MNYTEAAEKLGSRDRRKIAHNTYLERREDGAIAVRFHATDIITFTPLGVAELNTGGWFTVTTKDRLNRFAPYGRVYSERGEWFISLGQNLDPEPFFDGIRLAAGPGDFGVLNSRRDEVATESARRRKIKARITRYAKLSAETLAAGMPGPSGGDCWYCVMQTEDGETLGDVVRDSDHLESHLEEGYVVPALLWNAVRAAGYRYPEIILGARKDEDGTVSMGHGAMSDSVRRAVVKYLSQRMIVGASGAVGRPAS